MVSLAALFGTVFGVSMTFAGLQLYQQKHIGPDVREACRQLKEGREVKEYVRVGSGGTVYHQGREARQGNSLEKAFYEEARAELAAIRLRQSEERTIDRLLAESLSAEDWQ